MEFYPSLISSDLLNLRSTLALLDPHVHGYHIDVMDDHFVPNLTWGPAFVSAIRQTTQLPLHIHCMVDNPEKWIDRLELYQGDTLLFHVEAFKDTKACHDFFFNAHNVCKHRLGIVLNPETDIESIFPILKFVDNVLVMSVNPGFSGQTFIGSVMSKIPKLMQERKIQNHSFVISMDGGINQSNIAMLAEHGVEQVGMANALFGQDDPIKALNELVNLTS